MTSVYMYFHCSTVVLFNEKWQEKQIKVTQEKSTLYISQVEYSYNEIILGCFSYVESQHHVSSRSTNYPRIISAQYGNEL